MKEIRKSLKRLSKLLDKINRRYNQIKVREHIEEERIKRIELKILELLYKTRKITALRGLGIEIESDIDEV